MKKYYLLPVFVFMVVLAFSINVNAETDTTPPVITNARHENITSNSARIRWATDDLSDTKVYYGIAPGTYTFAGGTRCDTTGNTTDHCINLSGLYPNTVYYYKIISTNSSYLSGYAEGLSFTSGSSSEGSGGGSGSGNTYPTPTPMTDANPTPTPNLINLPLPPSNFKAVVYGSKVILTWADNENEVYYNIYRRLAGGSWAAIKSLSANTVTYTDENVPVGSYEYDAKACNSSGCSAYSNIGTATIGATGSFDTKTVVGKVIFSDGRAVTDAEVGAYSLDNGFSVSKPVDAGGYYSLTLSGGRWQIAVRPKDPKTANWTYSGQYMEVNFVRDSSVETRTFSTTIIISDSKLTVSTVDSDGIPVTNTGVIVDTISAGQSSSTTTSGTSAFVNTGIYAKAAFELKSGTYYVRGHLPYESEYINPPEQVITFAGGESKELKLIFNKKTISTAIYIKGSTKLEGGTSTDAYIWAWSEKGRSAKTYSAPNGDFSLQVSSDDKWHLGAGKIIDGIPYKSSEIIVPVGNTSVSVELILAALSELPLPPTAVTTRSATQEIITTTQDGAKVTVPANTIATSDPITVEVKPTIEAPSQSSARVIGNAYNVSVKNPVGHELKEFGNEVVFEIPYKEADLVAQGITEDKIVPSFFDEATGTWVKVDNYTVDKDRNVVIARVRHLTLFAIVLAADIVPPSPPSSVQAVAVGGGQINLTWVNPSGDFDHINIYRSENISSLGRLEGTVKSPVFTDDLDVKNGVTYYYVIRAVDPAGNETSNTTPTAVKAVGDSSKTLSNSALKDGDMISAAGSDDPDIYIINTYGYKRLFLNPVIFSFYGHLGGFQNVKSVNSTSRDSYKTSGLFRNCETDDPRVYGVEVTGEDSGTIHWINISGAQAVAEDADFFKKVFCINNNEFNWYGKSSNFVSLGQVPKYSR